ncbi:pyridoxamine 5'-phosphate oxidase family protein [Paenibacillus aurantius]|uniref:Pyridoxamine 5'-phosphate oxidase family protein n=1 Tax=Paenibacillus aurantius TaxID=2918900 RepID=A0AA96REU1_9BACL|nr:pyridoxamine 5'-phosphate oxidase family protein [Paenibacillus aurantius]WNQ12820.1 pyridoxamine 5'-phosphate oxidase family protein [Paenibacillus aurantius]
MRRNEFAVNELQEIEDFLGEMTFGFLAMEGRDGWPAVTPLNYVYTEEKLYFHGSRAGSKMDDLKASGRCTFQVAKEYALIPSYFSDSRLACPATSYFKSVQLRGTAAPVEDLEEKARALSAFMVKLQPEGGYDPISTDDKNYRAALKGVAVVRLEVEEISAKFKFGQNLKEPAREQVAGALENRGLALDPETAALMRKYCPAHRGAVLE